MSSPLPKPPQTPASVVIPRPGLLARLKLSEPTRLYGYSVLAAIAVAAGAAGLVTEDLSVALEGLAAAVLAVPGVEAVRASVYSPASYVTGTVAAGQRALAAARVDEAAGW